MTRSRADDVDADPDTVEVTLAFDAPVTRADLRERFQELAERLADDGGGDDADEPTPLRECPVCGAVGLPERIADHDCVAFLDGDR